MFENKRRVAIILSSVTIALLVLVALLLVVFLVIIPSQAKKSNLKHFFLKEQIGCRKLSFYFIARS